MARAVCARLSAGAPVEAERGTATDHVLDIASELPNGGWRWREDPPRELGDASK